MLPEKICPFCQKSFIPIRNRQKFCSHVCSKNFLTRGIIKICPNCKKEFKARKNATKFCSKSCSSTINSSKNKLVKDPSCFENLDNNAAYIIGFILADGCLVTKNNKSGFRNYITIGCNDRNIIEKIQTRMCPTKKISKTKTNCYYISSNNEYDYSYLLELGLTPRKSLTATLPSLSNELMSHLIRGYFDGDGCVYISAIKKGKKYLAISFTSGSKKLLEQLQEFFRNINISSNISRDCRKPTYYLKIYSKESILNFYNYIYKDADFKMDRKYNKFN